MQVLRDAGDLAKGDQKGRKGGTKGEFESRSKVTLNNITKLCASCACASINCQSYI